MFFNTFLKQIQRLDWSKVINIYKVIIGTDQLLISTIVSFEKNKPLLSVLATQPWVIQVLRNAMAGGFF